MARWYELLVRPLLFRLGPEQAHGFAMFWLKILGAAAPVRRLAEQSLRRDSPVDCFGIRFPNPVGLAAGFDKDAEALPAWEALGFGFVEAGTITAKPQPGNPPPRLFRYPARKALVNRMGFNNEGADAVADRLHMLKDSGRWPRIPIGINIGKSKTTALKDAPADYVHSYRKLHPFADYFAVNVSSPNTPGLRSLQSVEMLEPLLSAIQDENAGTLPVLVKIAPDLEFNEIDAIARLAERLGLAGLIATNTTLDHSALDGEHDEQGGLSGSPLRDRSTDILRHLHNITPLPVIGSGGVMDADAAREKFDAGASLVQLYTGFIYRGPTLTREIVRALPDTGRKSGAG